jgi:hypothetical protein
LQRGALNSCERHLPVGPYVFVLALTIPGKRLAFRNGRSRRGYFGYMNHKNFVKPFLAALHKTVAIVNFPPNGKFYMQKIAHTQAELQCRIQENFRPFHENVACISLPSPDSYVL